MELYGVAIIILLIAVSYTLGMKTANWYNDKAFREQREALERQYLRLRAGTDYYDPVGPYKVRGIPLKSQKCFSPAQLEEFETRLKNNGSATVMFNPTTKEKEK